MPKLIENLAKKVLMEPLLDRMDTRENSILDAPVSHRWTAESPIRFHIMREGLKRGNFKPSRLKSPLMFRCLLDIFKSIRDLKKNKPQHKREISEIGLQDLNEYLYSLGISSIGYTEVPMRWVFRDKAVMYANAIVTSMEMDEKKIATAPSPAAGKAAHEIYFKQGVAMIKGAEFLRQRGYAAHAGHPLMGMALYPPLAQLAGLGQLAVSGLMITPEHGPRVRLASIFTDIENLPFSSKPNHHEWVLDFCEQCQICVKKCPEEAIYGKPEISKTGQITCIDTDRCFPYFMATDGCAVCIKTCPFNTTPYDKLHVRHQQVTTAG